MACHTRIGVSGMSSSVTPNGRRASSTELTTKVPLELFVEVELANFRVITSELLRTEYPVSEGYGWPDDDHGVIR